MVSGTGRARAGVGPGPVRSAQTWPGRSRDRFRSCTGGPGGVPVPDPFVHTGPGGVPVPSRLWVRGAGTGPGPVRANVAGAGESRYRSGSCTRGCGEVSEPARFVSTWLGGVGVPVRGHGAGGRSGSRVGVIHGAGPSTRGWGGPRVPPEPESRGITGTRGFGTVARPPGDTRSARSPLTGAEPPSRCHRCPVSPADRRARHRAAAAAAGAAGRARRGVPAAGGVSTAPGDAGHRIPIPGLSV